MQATMITREGRGWRVRGLVFVRGDSGVALDELRFPVVSLRSTTG